MVEILLKHGDRVAAEGTKAEVNGDEYLASTSPVFFFSL